MAGNLGGDFDFQIKGLISATMDKKAGDEIEKALVAKMEKAAKASGDAFTEVFKEMAGMINTMFSKSNVKPIDIEKLLDIKDTKKALQEFKAEFSKTMTSIDNDVISDGVNNAMREELERLTEQRKGLAEEYEKIQKTIKNKTDIERVNKEDISEPLKVSGDLKSEAKRVREELMEAYRNIYQFDMDTPEYTKAVIDAQDKANQLLRMYQNLQQGKLIELAGERKEYEALINNQVVEIEDSFEEISEITDGLMDLEQIENSLKRINAEIDDLTKTLKSSDGSALKDMADDAKDMEAALKRMRNEGENTYNKPKKKKLDALVGDEPLEIDEGLKALKTGYDKAVAKGLGWEEEYQWLVKFVQKYEQLEAMGKNQKTRDEFKDVYASFKEQYSGAVSALKELRTLMDETPTTARPKGSDKEGVSGQQIGANKDAIQSADALAKAAEREKNAQEASAKAEKEKANARRDTLVAELDKYGGDVLSSQEADDNLKKIQETYEVLKKEGLLTEELEESYTKLNQRLEERANLLRQAEGYYDDIDDELTGSRVNAIDSEEQYRKDHIKPFDDTITKMSESGLFSDSELEKFEKISKSMENRTKQLPFDQIFSIGDIYNTEDLAELESRLERIKSIMTSAGEENMSMFDPTQYDDVLSLMGDIERRMDVIRADQDDDIYRRINDELGYIPDMFESSQELTEKLQQRQEAMSQIYFNDDDYYKELEKENEAIQERISLMKELEPLVQSGKLTQDDLESIVYERGSLDERREVLEGIKLDIINQDEDDTHEALNNAQQLLDVYEKISVVTASGKRLELGPEMSPEDFQAFMRSDPESAKSIEFIRKAAIEADAAVDDLNESLEQTNKLGSGGKAGSGTGDASSAEVERLQQENKALLDKIQEAEQDSDYYYGRMREAQDETNASEKRAQEAEEELARIKAESDGKKLVDKDVPDDDSELKSLRAQLENEQQMRVDTERALEQEVSARFTAEERINKVQEENEQLRKQLADVDTTPNKGVKQTIGGDIDVEATQLKNVLEAVEAVTEAVNKKNKAFQNEGEIVGQAVGKEIKALSHLETQVTGINEELAELFGTLKNVKTNAKTEIKVKVEDVDTKKQSDSKPKETDSSEETPKRSKADMNALEKDYEQLGRLWARLDDDNLLKQSAIIENLEAEIKRKQESLGLTEKEIAALKEKEKVAERAEENIIQAEKAQAAKDKKAADQAKFDSDVEKLAKQYEKLGVLQAEADANVPGKKAEVEQLERVIQQETERLGLNKEQNAEILKSIQLRQQEAQASKAALLADKQRVKDENAEWKAQVKAARGNAGVNVANSAVTAGNRIVTDVIGDTSITKDIEAKARELQEATRELANMKDQVSRAIAEGAEADSDGLARQTKQVKELTEEMNELMAVHRKYADAEDIGDDIGSFKDLDDDEYRKQLTAIAEASVNGKLRSVEFKNETKELIGTVKTGANEFTTYSFAIDEVSGKVKKLNQGTKQTESFFEGMARKTKELAQYALSSISIYDVWNQIRNGVQYVREIDTAMTELRKVTNETEASYDNFLKTASATGSRIGSTISDFTQATATFAKLGYSMDAASKMAESAIVYQNVGDGIESAEAAAESIISTMKGFGLEASNTMAIVDSFNEVGNKFAIDSKGVGDALMRSASAMSMAGNSMHEAVGLAAAANTVVNFVPRNYSNIVASR